jgi:RNA polymerase sigma-70 factor, ECF subfamily
MERIMTSNDLRLIEQAKTDPAAFGQLYDAHYDQIVRYAYHHLPDRATAEDVTSEVFLKAMKALPRFKPQSGVPFSAWLYKIAANEIASYFRRSQRARLLSLDFLIEAHQFEPPSDEDIEQDLIDREATQQAQRDYQLLKQLLPSLPRKYREVIVLRYFEHKKIQEIATITSKNTNTVKSLLKRGVAKLTVAYEAHKNHQLQPLAHPGVITGEDNLQP